MRFYKALFLFAAILLLGNPCDAQMLGMPSPTVDESQWDKVTSMVPEEEPMICVLWNKAGVPNPDGNPSDQWFANEEIQKSRSDR